MGKKNGHPQVSPNEFPDNGRKKVCKLQSKFRIGSK